MIRRAAAFLAAMALVVASASCAVLHVVRDPPTPPSGFAWHCFHAEAPPGGRFIDASTSCHQSLAACVEARAEELRRADPRGIEPALIERREGDGSDGAIARAGKAANRSRAFVAQPVDAPPVRESAPATEGIEEHGDDSPPPPESEGGGLDDICKIDPTQCPSVAFGDVDDVPLSACRPASEVHCSPFRHEYNYYREGETIWGFSCHETAADCEMSRHPKRSFPLHVVDYECVATR